MFSGLHQLAEFKPLKISLPIPSPLPFPIREAIMIGNCINEDAKITGTTPAVFTLIGMNEDWPPTDLLPCIFCEYWTATFLCPPCNNTTNTTTNAIKKALREEGYEDVEVIGMVKDNKHKIKEFRDLFFEKLDKNLFTFVSKV